MQLLADGQISDISQQVIVAYIYIHIYIHTRQHHNFSKETHWY